MTIRKLAGVDVETTRLDTSGKILEIGIVLLSKDLSVISSIRLKCKVDEVGKAMADPVSMQINGLDIDAGYDKETVIKMLETWMINNNVDQLIPLGCNYDKFDYWFLRDYFGEKTYNIFFYHISRDIIHVAAYLNDQDVACGDGEYFFKYHDNKGKEHSGLSLRDLCNRLEIAYNNGHDCIVDATTTAQVYKELVQLI